MSVTPAPHVNENYVCSYCESEKNPAQVMANFVEGFEGPVCTDCLMKYFKPCAWDGCEVFTSSNNLHRVGNDETQSSFFCGDHCIACKMEKSHQNFYVKLMSAPQIEEPPPAGYTVAIPGSIKDAFTITNEKVSIIKQQAPQQDQDLLSIKAVNCLGCGNAIQSNHFYPTLNKCINCITPEDQYQCESCGNAWAKDEKFLPPTKICKQELCATCAEKVFECPRCHGARRVGHKSIYQGEIICKYCLVRCALCNETTLNELDENGDFKRGTICEACSITYIQPSLVALNIEGATEEERELLQAARGAYREHE